MIEKKIYRRLRHFLPSVLNGVPDALVHGAQRAVACSRDTVRAILPHATHVPKASRHCVHTAEDGGEGTARSSCLSPRCWPVYPRRLLRGRRRVVFFLVLSRPLASALLFAAAAAIATIVSIAAGNTNYAAASRSTLTQLDEYGRPFTTSDSWIRTNDPELRGSLEESSSLRSRRLSG